MNTTEHIVETYYRLVEKCFTVSDIKIINGNNRQIDILGFRPSNDRYYHVEVAVTHCENWCPALDDIEKFMGHKFFGKPKNNRPDNPNTDFGKGKSYLEQFKETYKLYGVDFNKVIRVWCSWRFDETEEKIKRWKKSIANAYKLSATNFELLSFRDTVLPKLLDEIGTSNYYDEILRTLSLLNQFDSQRS